MIHKRSIILAFILITWVIGWFFLKSYHNIPSLLNSDSTDITQEKPPTKEKITASSKQITQILQQKLMRLHGSQMPVEMLLSDQEKQQVIDQAFDQLKNAEHYEDRELAVKTLAAFPSLQTMKGVILALKDPISIVRQQAVMQVAYWPDPKQQTEILLVALDNEDPDTVFMALEFLGSAQLADTRVLGRLSSLTKDDRSEIREMALLTFPVDEQQ
jgi:hypothetical protein